VYEFCSVANCGDGSSPNALDTLVSGAFYGTTDGGGANNAGTVWKLVASGAGGGGGGCTYQLGTTNQNFAASGGSSTVSVIASNGCAWSAMSNDGFITLTGNTNGTGNGTVHYTVAENSTTNPVTGTMTIAGLTFTVTQAAAGGGGGCTFMVSPSLIKLANKGGSKSVSVKAQGTGCDWTAVSNDSFITITAGASGMGSGKVTFTVPGNTNTTSLVGTLTIAGQTVTVTQAVGGCTFKLSPKDGKIKQTGTGTKPATIKVSPNLNDCDWTAVSNNGFITLLSGTNGVGKGTVTYSVSTNATSNILTGSVTVAGQTFTVIQAGEKP